MADGKKAAKWGCLGCLAILVVLLISALGLGGLVWMEVSNEALRTEDFELEAPSEPSDPASFGVEFRFAVDSAEVHLKSIEAGGELNIEAEYDESTYAFEQSQVPDDGDGIVWNVGFQRTSKLPFGKLIAMFVGRRPKIRIDIPEDVPFTLTGEISGGSLQGDVGGTRLREVDMDFSRGGMVVSIAEPLEEPMRRFRLSANQGGVVLSNLGNASPREINIECKMGGGVVDLEGDWKNDATIELSAKMGGGALSLPEDVTVEGLAEVKGFDPRDFANPDPEVPFPRLLFQVKGDWEIQ